MKLLIEFIVIKTLQLLIIFTACLDAHLPYGFIIFGVVAKPNEFPFMVCPIVIHMYVYILKNY